MRRVFSVATAHLSAGLRLGAGLFVGELGPRPDQPIELYDYEACPFCRRVREAVTALDLRAVIYPCPRGGGFRDVVRERGGREMFPFMVDPNTDTEMYESADIVEHLYKHYGASAVPLQLRGPLFVVSSALASAARATRGGYATESEVPEQMLELYSFESSPYCKLVREELSSMAIPYVLHSVAKKSPSRAAFVERSGRMMVPFLVDPNTGVEMFESADIVDYLRQTYR